MRNGACVGTGILGQIIIFRALAAVRRFAARPVSSRGGTGDFAPRSHSATRGYHGALRLRASRAAPHAPSKAPRPSARKSAHSALRPITGWTISINPP